MNGYTAKMPNQHKVKLITIIVSFMLGILINSALLLFIFFFLDTAGVFWVVSILFISHMILNIILVLYRRGKILGTDLKFIRFGPLLALWEIVKICG